MKSVLLYQHKVGLYKMLAEDKHNLHLESTREENKKNIRWIYNTHCRLNPQQQGEDKIHLSSQLFRSEVKPRNLIKS